MGQCVHDFSRLFFFVYLLIRKFFAVWVKIILLIDFRLSWSWHVSDYLARKGTSSKITLGLGPVFHTRKKEGTVVTIFTICTELEFSLNLLLDLGRGSCLGLSKTWWGGNGSCAYLFWYSWRKVEIAIVKLTPCQLSCSRLQSKIYASV